MRRLALFLALLGAAASLQVGGTAAGLQVGTLRPVLTPRTTSAIVAQARNPSGGLRKKGEPPACT